MGHNSGIIDSKVSFEIEKIEQLGDYEIASMIDSVVVLKLLFGGLLPPKDLSSLSKLLEEFGSLDALFGASVSQLRARSTLCDEAILRLKAARWGLTKVQNSRVFGRSVFDNWEQTMKDVSSQFTPFHQCVSVSFLNARQELIKSEIHQRGTNSECKIYPREIVRRMLEIGANGLLIVHHVPQGSLSFSDATLSRINAIEQTLKLLDLVLVDYILTNEKGTNSAIANELIAVCSDPRHQKSVQQSELTPIDMV